MGDAIAVELDGQYRLLREEAGAARRDELAVLAVTGPDAVPYLQSQITQDVEKLADGEGAYAALLDRKGHMRTDMRVLRAGAEELLLVLERIGAEAALTHLRMYSIGHQTEVEDRSEQTAVISVAGPASAEVAGVALPAAEHSHAPAEVEGIAARAVRTDVGLDLLCAAGDAERLLAALEQRGAHPVDVEALEILRVESGRPRFGREMTTRTIPQEAGINERAVSFTKGCYIGQETVARLHYKGKPNRHLRGLRLAGPAAQGDEVRLGERVVGEIGTAVVSPVHGRIALAILRREAQPGDTVLVGDGVEATVVEPPFAASEREGA
jgi:folate-binding protein YgfZ